LRRTCKCASLLSSCAPRIWSFLQNHRFTGFCEIIVIDPAYFPLATKPKFGKYEKKPTPKRSERTSEISGNNTDQVMIELVKADSPEKLEKARGIFLRYARSLDFDLSFQGFAAELAGLPGDYGPPTGCLLLALEKSETAGCVALRKIGDGVCEMKRLFINPQQRGKGIGRILTNAVVQEAKRLGYKRMRLDTVPSMTSAIGLYRSLGFEEIPPYCHNPVPGAKFFELRLRPERSANDCYS
jgi:putative acetyltransferase